MEDPEPRYRVPFRPVAAYRAPSVAVAADKAPAAAAGAAGRTPSIGSLAGKKMGPGPEEATSQRDRNWSRWDAAAVGEPPMVAIAAERLRVAAGDHTEEQPQRTGWIAWAPLPQRSLLRTLAGLEPQTGIRNRFAPVLDVALQENCYVEEMIRRCYVEQGEHHRNFVAQEELRKDSIHPNVWNSPPTNRNRSRTREEPPPTDLAIVAELLLFHHL